MKILEARAGSVQLTNAIQVKDFEAIQSESSLQLVDTPIFTHQWMAFNVTKAPFDNPALRKAVLTAIDRNALEKVVSRGFGVVSRAKDVGCALRGVQRPRDQVRPVGLDARRRKDLQEHGRCQHEEHDHDQQFDEQRVAVVICLHRRSPHGLAAYSAHCIS